MQENEFSRSTSPRRRSRAPHKEPHATGVLEVQAVLCMVAVLAALLVKFAGGGLYAGVRGAVKTAVQQNITGDEVKQVFGQLRKKFPDAVWVFNNLGSGASSLAGGVSSAVSGASSQAGGASSGVSSSSKAASSKASKASTASKAAAAAASSGAATSKTAASASSQIKKTSLTGAGGPQLSVPGGILGGSALPAPKGATLAPVLLTIRPRCPLAGTLTSKFGYRLSPITGKLGFHAGLDIAAPSGTPICAALPGRVQKVDKSESYGNFITLDNGGGVITLYAHCSKIDAQEGQSVRAGDVIAQVGSTGEATGPHCHFEVRVQGVRVNPLPLLL